MGTKHTKWATAAVAVVAVFGGTVGVAAAAWKIQANGWLTDLRTTTSDATDGARAHVVAEPVGAAVTHVTLKVQGLDHLVVGRTYGAHVHTGTCATDLPADAGPHFKHLATPTGDVVDNEIWLDFTVERGGVARAERTVQFAVPEGGAHSVVIHDLPTAATGAAGARIACIPVDF